MPTTLDLGMTVGGGGRSVSAALLQNLVSWWKLDEAAGANRADSHGSNTLTITGTVGQVAGKLSNAADFNAGANRLSVADNSTISMGNGVNFSIAGWCFLDSTANSCAILGKNAGTTGAAMEYMLMWSAASRFIFYAADGTTLASVNASNTGLSISTWYHVAATMNGSTGAIITYFNGAQYTTGTGTYAQDGGNAATIGDRSVGGFNPDARVDEVGLWKRVLSAAEIAYLYNSGNGRTYPFA